MAWLKFTVGLTIPALIGWAIFAVTNDHTYTIGITLCLWTFAWGFLYEQ